MLKTLSGRAASQNEFELRSFIALLQERGVRSYLEIGARHGDTFHEVMRSLPTGSRGVAVDLPGGLWGTQKSRRALEAAVAYLQLRGYQADHLFADSQDPEIARRIGRLGRFDAILIDGDHTLAGVTRDWENYGGMADIVAFHDVVGTGQIEKVGGRPVEVPLLWAQLKETRHYVEFVDAGSAMGIGVLLCE